MKKGLMFFCIMFFSVSLFALEKKDSDSIHSVIEHFTDAWNQSHGKGVGECYTSDADFVNIFGMHFFGKDEIEDRHVKIHETILKNSQFEVTDVKLREVKPSVVIAQVHWKVSGVKKNDAKFLPETLVGVFTHVFVQNENGWEITSTQNTLISQ